MIRIRLAKIVVISIVLLFSLIITHSNAQFGLFRATKRNKNKKKEQQQHASLQQQQKKKEKQGDNTWDVATVTIDNESTNKNSDIFSLWKQELNTLANKFNEEIANLSKMSPEELQEKLDKAERSLQQLLANDGSFVNASVEETKEKRDEILQRLEESVLISPQELEKYKTDPKYLESKIRETSNEFQSFFNDMMKLLTQGGHSSLLFSSDEERDQLNRTHPGLLKDLKDMSFKSFHDSINELLNKSSKEIEGDLKQMFGEFQVVLDLLDVFINDEDFLLSVLEELDKETWMKEFQGLLSPEELKEYQSDPNFLKSQMKQASEFIQEVSKVTKQILKTCQDPVFLKMSSQGVQGFAKVLSQNMGNKDSNFSSPDAFNVTDFLLNSNDDTIEESRLLLLREPTLLTQLFQKEDEDDEELLKLLNDPVQWNQMVRKGQGILFQQEEKEKEGGGATKTK